MDVLESSDHQEKNSQSNEEYDLLGFKNDEAEIVKPNVKESAEESTSTNFSMENQKSEFLPEIFKITENIPEDAVKTCEEYLRARKSERLSNIKKTAEKIEAILSEESLETTKSETVTKFKNYKVEILNENVSAPKYKIFPKIANLNNTRTHTSIQKSENITGDVIKENHIIKETASDAENKKNVKVVKLEVDEMGQKFINLNGKKLKVIREVVREANSSQAPKVLPNPEEQKSPMIYQHKTINIGSADSPLKVRVISQVTHLDGNLQKKDKIKPLDPSTVKPISDSSDKETSLEVDFPSDPQDPDEIIPRDSKLLSQRVLKVLNFAKMKALDLSLKTPSELTTTPQKLFSEQAVQTDEVEKTSNTTSPVPTIASHDSGCQTDPYNLLDLDWFENDSSPIINNVDFGTGPTIGKVAWPNNSNTSISNNSFINTKSSHYDDANLKKKIQFFNDLRNALLPDGSGNLLIHEGVLKQDKDLVKRMCIVLRARHFDVNQETHDGCTPLQLAVINNVRHDIVETLLDYGAEVGDCDGDGNNIIHLAAKFQRFNHLQVIFYHRFFESHYKQFLDHFNFEGLTALMICCMSGWYQGVELFVRSGADINLRDQKSGRTPLFHSAETHDEHIVRLLLENGADAKIKNFFGTSPHDAMYELDDMPDAIKSLIFGKTKKRSMDAEMNPTRTAKAAKTLKTYPKFQRVEKFNDMIVVSTGIKMVQEPTDQRQASQGQKSQPGQGRIRKTGKRKSEPFQEPMEPAIINLSELHNQINKQQNLMLQQSHALQQESRHIVQKSQG